MLFRSEPRIVSVRCPPPALHCACVGYNRRSRKGKADPSSSTRGLGCVAADVVDATREVGSEAIRQGLRRSCECAPPRPFGARHYAASSLAQPRTSDRCRGPSASNPELHAGRCVFSSCSSQSHGRDGYKATGASEEDATAVPYVDVPRPGRKWERKPYVTPMQNTATLPRRRRGGPSLPL